MAFNKKEWQKKYDLEHRDIRIKRGRERRIAKKEECAEYSRKYHQAHREEKKAYKKKYDADPANHKKEKSKIYDEAHKKERADYYIANKEKFSESHKKRYQKNKVALLQKNVERLYGITHADWLSMLAKQNGRCAICGVHNDDVKKRLHVDHDHETGINRGLLCHRCNMAIGLLADSSKVALSGARYLESYGK